MRLEDERAFAVTVLALRVIARVVITQGHARGLLAFGTADNHLHALLVADRTAAGAFARYVASALRARLAIAARFEAARIRPLHDQRHLTHAFHYVHRQQGRHELGLDPMGEGTSLPDLLGLRVIGSMLVERVRQHLPRIDRVAVARSCLPALIAAVDDQAAPVDGEVLVDAAAAAFALPDLRGQSEVVVRARRAAVHAAPREMASTGLGDLLEIGARAVRSFRAAPAEPFVVRAVRGQALLRMAVSRGGSSTP